MTQKNNTIDLEDRVVTYTLKRFARQKRINVHVRDGRILVTAPLRATERGIERVLRGSATWILQHADEKKEPKNVTIEPSTVHFAKKVLARHIHDALEKYNAHYGFAYNRVTIRAQVTRWGSCSSEGNLSFNIALMGLEPHLRDYVVVHELCHLKEMNHSAAFWELVGEMVPDYKALRKMLKLHST